MANEALQLPVWVVEWLPQSKLKYEPQVSGHRQSDIFSGRGLAFLGGL